MYNLYTQEKQLNEERDKKKEEESIRRYKEKRKSKISINYHYLKHLIRSS